MIETAFNILFALLLSGGILWFILVTKYFRHMATRHPQLFESLGRPSLILNNTPGNMIRFIRYIRSSDCVDTKDESLIAQTRMLRFMFHAYLAMFIFLIGAVFAIVFLQ
jgi:hypothetical protein